MARFGGQYGVSMWHRLDLQTSIWSSCCTGACGADVLVLCVCVCLVLCWLPLLMTPAIRAAAVVAQQKYFADASGERF